MRALLSAISLGIVGLMIMPATLMVLKLTDAQLDRILRAGVFLCSSVLGLLALVGVVAFLAWRDERRRNAALGPMIDAQPWRPMSAHYTPVQPQQALPQPAMWQMGPGNEGDYDLMPADGDTRYKFRPQR